MSDQSTTNQSNEQENSGGIRITYNGRTPPWQIVRKVKPRALNIVKYLSNGNESEQSSNMIIEGENLQAMVSLYKYRGQVNLIVADPPYNTGNDFRYNDKWDVDPNDPDLGKIVPKDDGSRHTKWLRFMTPRVWMMKEMLKPNGVLAICIDERELFRLGMLLDEIFGEENRIAIINWQKSYSPKSDSKHISRATEYVLVYAKDSDSAKTGLQPRGESTNSKYKNPDNDVDLWRSDNATVATPAARDRYAIQSPFSGALHYPGSRAWTHPKKNMKKWIQQWGCKYVEKDLKDGRPKALVIKGAPIPVIPEDTNLNNNPVVTDSAVYDDSIVEAAREAAIKVRDNEVWPFLYFTSKGFGRPSVKRYLNQVKKGIVPLTYWANEDYDNPMYLGSQSWDHTESGHSQTGINELNAIMGKGHNFQTVKPLKLITKIIQLWCPPDGIVLDPFAGSGTTGHAVLLANKIAGTNRRFILIEQGREERGDPYARTLTAERIKRSITGEWSERPFEPLPGGFRFVHLTKKVDAAAVLALEKEEMIDLLVISHWEQQDRGANHLQRLEPGAYNYLFATNSRNEGYFLVWDGPNSDPILDRETFHKIAAEAKAAGLNKKYHVYARLWSYQGPNIEFYQIPDRVLAHLGYNEAIDAYNEEEE
ncbi:site-specific DNA-methyltransferase [Bacillus sp. RAR_GA_16]|uniref:site-specific DNA-methyltransferase n=1 Tax=Bacillus sp. RAR_GA_16 TaxID=2876774 RepID=UPI001CCA61FA|nr:site-specific DNA-methyltransferase [Bacillus sp. RAR_GA_16]MCA0174618.1 site-specific DNA-methyltransferase [Bacillus sp. RAR_GA_16]